MPLVIVTVAGNYITISCADLQRLLRFPRLGLVIIYAIISTAVVCVMFHSKNNNVMCQKEPAAEPGRLRKEFVIDDRGVSQALRMTPVRLRSESAVTMSGNRTSLMAKRFTSMPYLSHLRGQARRGGGQGLSWSTAQFIPLQGLGKASSHSRGRIRAAQP